VRIADSSVPVVALKLFKHCGVGMMRSLGRLGIEVYGVDVNPANPAFCSRYCRGKFIWNFDRSTADQTTRYLKELAAKLGRRPILVSNGDVPSLFLADHAGELHDSFRIQTPSGDLARSLSDKREMYFLAKKYGVPTAETFFPQSGQEVLSFLESGQAKFPIMLKGINSARLEERTGLRMIIVENKADLLDRYEQMEEPGSPNLMFQEYIPGGDDSVWMFNGYFNAQSECLYGVTGRKLRQYPVYTGMTSLGICLQNDFVDKTTREFMKALGYKGILDLGYRFDARDGEYKLLDVNPRIGATFRLFVEPGGLDVLRALYLDLTGQPVPAAGSCEGRKWIVESNDVIAFRQYRKDGEMTILSWLRSFKGVQEGGWFAWDDPVPFLLMCGSLARYLLGFLRKSLGFSPGQAPAGSTVPD
jgi:D-aspartate ligase